MTITIGASGKSLVMSLLRLKSLQYLEGATETSSLMPRSLEAAGCTVKQILGHDPNVCHLRFQILIEKVLQ